MKSLIIGAGEVGTALFKILREKYEVYIWDKIGNFPSKVDILHICFPYSGDFIGDVKDYVEIYRPKYTVVHSTVPVGTCRQIQAFHSPVRGMHPELKNHLRVFPKYLAPPDKSLKRYFEGVGIPIKMVDRTETTEFLKIWDTAQYGISIWLEKWAFQFCEENNLDFKIAYTHANESYNEGYSKLGRKDVVRPILKHREGPIGGHCVVPNCKLLKSPFTNLILRLNREYENKKNSKK